MGDDPIRLISKGDPCDFHPDDLHWEQLASWSQDETPLAVEIGRSQDGNLCAYRVIGEVQGTARSLSAELGWLIPDSPKGAINVPFVDPNLWSSEWRSFCHGKIDDSELIQRLSTMTAAQIRLPLPDAESKKKRLVLAALFLVISMALGFVAGWFSKSYPIEDKIPKSQESPTTTSPTTPKLQEDNSPEESPTSETQSQLSDPIESDSLSPAQTSPPTR